MGIISCLLNTVYVTIHCKNLLVLGLACFPSAQDIVPQLVLFSLKCHGTVGILSHLLSASLLCGKSVTLWSESCVSNIVFPVTAQCLTPIFSHGYFSFKATNQGKIWGLLPHIGTLVTLAQATSYISNSAIYEKKSMIGPQYHGLPWFVALSSTWVCPLNIYIIS